MYLSQGDTVSVIDDSVVQRSPGNETFFFFLKLNFIDCENLFIKHGMSTVSEISFNNQIKLQ